MSSVKYDRQESSTKSGLLRKRSSSPSTYVALAPNSSAITWDRSALFNFPTSVSQDYHLSHRFSRIEADHYPCSFVKSAANSFRSETGTLGLFPLRREPTRSSSACRP
jgi:hypothetical protein